MTTFEPELTDSTQVEQTVADEETDIEIDEETTIPGQLRHNAETDPEGVAMRWKRYSVWEEYTWAEYFERVSDIAAGLEASGFGKDDIVFTIGYNRPHQVWTWIGAQILGGSAAPNYYTMLPEGLLKQLQLLEPTAVYAEDQEMVDRILSVADECPSIELIIYRDSKGMFRYDDVEPSVVSVDEIESRGSERRESSPDGYIDKRIERIDQRKPALLSPTSGTTGTPKRVKLSHFNLINIGNAMHEIERLPAESNYFSFLPLAWAGEQMTLLAQALVSRWTVNFAEAEETTEADFREVGPQAVVSSPDRYEEWVADIKAKIENTTRLKRWVYNKAMSVGYRYAEYISGEKRSEEPPAWLRAAHWLSYWVCYRPIRDKIGLKRGKNVYTGGAPLGEEHFRFFHALGIPLKQIWGQTEVGGYVTVHRDDDIRADTVGEVLPNVTVGIASNGELLVSGPVVTEGYHNQPDKTAEAIRDGWLHTDDYGRILDDGHIEVIDRMDDVIQLVDGTEVAPINIETKLKFNPYIKEALVLGDDRSFLTAVLNIRFENVAEWADQRDIQYRGYKDLAQKPAVQSLLRDTVEETNDRLADGLQIRRAVSLFKEFDPDDGELTQTGKLRREIITDRYDTLVTGLYNGADEIGLEVSITYQDGRESTEQGTVEVIDIEEGRY